MARDGSLVTKRLRTVLSLLVAAIVVSVGGYLFYALQASGTYTRADYVGTWKLSGPDGRVAKMYLNADGSAVIEDSPSILFSLHGYSEPDWKRTVRLEGSWSDQGGNQIFVDTRLGGPRFWAQGHDWGMSLSVVAGADPDNSPTFSFRR